MANKIRTEGLLQSQVYENGNLYSISIADLKGNDAVAETSNGKFNIPEEIIMSATQKRPICRFEEFDLTNDRNEKIHVILDVCHNQPGFEAMYATMQKIYPDVNLRVFSFIIDNDD